MNSIPGKICTSCDKVKSLDDFGKNSAQQDKRHYYCRDCVKYFNGINKEKNQQYSKEYREKNKEYFKNYQKEYRKKNSVVTDTHELTSIQEKKDKKRKKQRERSKDQEYVLKRRNYMKMKYRTDIEFKLKKQFQSRLDRLFKDNDTTEKSRSLIGCTIPEFKAYLESKFLKGMSLFNYGDVWEFRRIVSFCDFQLTDEIEARKCNHYSNIEPSFIQTKDIEGVD